MKSYTVCLGLCLFTLLSWQAAAQPAGEERSEQDSVIAQSCFVGENTFNCSLRADNDPNKIGAARPAAFAYTFNNDGDDSFAIEAAVKTLYALSADGTRNFSLSGLWHKNNQQKKEQDALSLGLGLTFEFNDGLNRRYEDDRNEIGPRDSQSYWYFDTSADLTYNRKAEFGDKARAECVADPDLRACGRQFFESARLSVVTAPYTTSFESPPPSDADKGSIYWVFSPTIGMFYDQAINDKVETYSGDAADGGVLGAQAGFKFALSPDLYDYRWELALSGQIVEVIDQDRSREADFEESARIFAASISYALGDSFVGEETKNKFLPALSLTYTNGSDPLKGRASQNSWVVGLTVKY